jgi:hydrogenase-4 component F
MNTTWLKIAFVLIVTGFSVKISVFPLFAVAVDAKTVAASPVNALMSTALVNVGFVGIYRTYTVISNSTILPWAQHVLMIIAVISIFLATIQLTRVKRIKRMYAFSSMEHMGIVLLGIAVGGVGYYAAILHLIFHSFVKAGLFYQVATISRFSTSIWIKDMGMYFKKNPLGGLAFILGIISILAIPPSGLFISEFLTFKAMFVNGNYIVAIAVLIMLTVIIYLFAKNAFHILFNNENIVETQVVKANPYETISQFVLFGLVIYLGINPPEFFTDLIHSAIAILN